MHPWRGRLYSAPTSCCHEQMHIYRGKFPREVRKNLSFKWNITVFKPWMTWTKLKQNWKRKFINKKNIFNFWPKGSSPNLSEHGLWRRTGPCLFSSPMAPFYFPQIMNETEIINCYQFSHFSLPIPLKVLLPVPGVLSQMSSTWQIPIYVSKHFEGTTSSLKPSLMSPSKSFSLLYYLYT